MACFLGFLRGDGFTPKKKTEQLRYSVRVDQYLREASALYRDLVGPTCMRGPLRVHAFTGEPVLLPCRSASCPACSVSIAKAMERAFDECAGTLVFYRLSYPDEERPGTWPEVAKHWHDFNQRLRRAWSLWGLTPWFRRIERGELLGHLHLHVVAKPPGLHDLWSLRDRLLAAWPFGGAASLDVQFPEVSGKVVQYLTGYVTTFAKAQVGNLSKSAVLRAVMARIKADYKKDRKPRKRPLAEHYFDRDEMPEVFPGVRSFWQKPEERYTEVLDRFRDRCQEWRDRAMAGEPLGEVSDRLWESRIECAALLPQMRLEAVGTPLTQFPFTLPVERQREAALRLLNHKDPRMRSLGEVWMEMSGNGLGSTK